MDLIYNAEIADYNVRSWKAFQRVGYKVVEKVEQAPGRKAAVGYDLALSRDTFLLRHKEGNCKISFVDRAEPTGFEVADGYRGQPGGGIS